MIAHLIEKANISHKVKISDCYLGASAKFFNGSIENIKLSEEECDAFTSYLNNSPDWQVTPAITSGGLIAKKRASLIGQNALPAWACNNRNIEDMLG